ncbi:unnamed protein product [Ambrosiozyma monospora]|uniref:Unnamed protein product n=1 Tax=Ambrosiozyma monospora TaxID=43982 RepID=A0ACB5U2T6_AMBMO|nr:unnamed protein product [Ambrosiozyma monospora]
MAPLSSQYTSVPDPRERPLRSVGSEDLELQTISLNNNKSSTTKTTNMEESEDSDNNSNGSRSLSDTGNNDVNFDIESGTRDSSDSMSFFEDDLNDSRVKRVKRKVIRFGKRLWKGPKTISDEPPTFKSSYLQQFENFPQRISKSFPFKIKIPFILMYYAFWLWFLREALNPYLTEIPTYKDSETNEDIDIISVNCRGERSIWRGKNAKCGLNAQKCGPFEEREVVFRCPALCDADSVTYSSITVGGESIKYRPFYVGGGKIDDNDDQYGSEVLSYPYRADS